MLTAFTRNMKSDRDELLVREIDPRAARVAALGEAHTLPELDRLATSSSPEAALAALARRHRERVIAGEARLHPPADLVARLGARPPMGPARQPWDEAVARTALYRDRYRPVPVPDGAYVSWALGPIPAHPAHRAAYRAAGTALLRAEQAGLAERSPAELAAERAQLRAALGPPSDQHRRQASLVHQQAQTAVAAAETRETDAGRAVAAAANPLLRKVSPKRLHAAEVEHAAAATTLARAQVDFRRSAERMAALDPHAVAEARTPLQQRLARIDGAIAENVRDAVASPAPYLSTALGPRPSDLQQRQRWNEAARQIEKWRHGELGLGPADGALADDGISAALDRPPTDPADALRRELAVRELPIEFQPHRTVDRAIEGPALTLD